MSMDGRHHISSRSSRPGVQGQYLPSKPRPIDSATRQNNTTTSNRPGITADGTSKPHFKTNTPLTTRKQGSPQMDRRLRQSSSSERVDAILKGLLASDRPTPTMTRKITSLTDNIGGMNISRNLPNIQFPSSSDNTPSSQVLPRYGRRSVTPEITKENSATSNTNYSNSYSSVYKSQSTTSNVGSDRVSSLSPTLSPVDSSLLKTDSDMSGQFSRRSNSNFNNNNNPPPQYNIDKVNRNVLEDIKMHNPIGTTRERVTATIGSTTSDNSITTHHHHSTSTPVSTSVRQLPAVLSTSSTASLQANQGLVGLRNLGNTCYMNSILQCLSATDSLTCVVIDRENRLLEKGKSKGIVQGYVELIKQMWVNDKTGSCVAPSMFKQRLQRLAPQFQGYDQHDSQEFLRFLLSGLHDELNSARPTKDRLSPSPKHSTDISEKADRAWKKTLSFDNSEISAIFMGQLKSTLKCQTCDHVSVTFDPFWDLSLPIPTRSSLSISDYRSIRTNSFDSDVTLNDCFKLFTTMERLDKDNKPLCEKCNSLQPGTKQLDIQRFPQILVIHLKRFSGVHFRTKLSTNIKFKQDMTLSSDDGSLSVQYQLYAISNHSGSCYGGHYTAYCKHPVQLKWYNFNDSSVAPVTSTQVHSSQAYVLFYKKMNEQS